MQERDFIATRLKQTFIIAEKYGLSFSEGSFHGPSLMEALKGVDHQSAQQHPLPGRHSIWEITNHCSYWMKSASNALSRSRLQDVEFFEDWPSEGETHKDWVSDLHTLEGTFKSLYESVLKMDDGVFSEVIESRFHGTIFKFTYRKMLHGIYDHNVYHAGQISLLKPKLK